jgi:hypothetical protein
VAHLPVSHILAAVTRRGLGVSYLHAPAHDASSLYTMGHSGQAARTRNCCASLCDDFTLISVPRLYSRISTPGTRVTRTHLSHSPQNEPTLPMRTAECANSMPTRWRSHHIRTLNARSMPSAGVLYAGTMFRRQGLRPLRTSQLQAFARVSVHNDEARHFSTITVA